MTSQANVPITIDLVDIPDGHSEDAAIDIDAPHIAGQFSHLTPAEKALRREELIKERHKRLARRRKEHEAMNPKKTPNDPIVISDSDEDVLQEVRLVSVFCFYAACNIKKLFCSLIQDRAHRLLMKNDPIRISRLFLKSGTSRSVTIGKS